MLYGVQVTGSGSPAIRAFESNAALAAAGNSWLLISDADGLAANKMVTTAVIVALFNELSEIKVERFSDRLSGAKRLLALVPKPKGANGPAGPAELKALATPGGAASHKAESEKPARTQEKKAKNPASDGGQQGGRGKRSRFQGHALVASAEATQENPRRKDTPGFKSLKLIIDQPGLLFEEFISKGGRLKDLTWDINAGNCTASPPNG